MNSEDQHSQPPKDAVPTYMLQDGTGELVKVLAEAISANRLPIPEPTVFSGDPLKFNHWKSSFQALIEKKNIPSSEKIFFLQKYVGGVANRKKPLKKPHPIELCMMVIVLRLQQ